MDIDALAYCPEHGDRKSTTKMLTKLLEAIENRHRDDVYQRLERATRNCSNAYAKGDRSFRVLSELTPANLNKYLPSFRRTRRILDQHLV